MKCQYNYAYTAIRTLTIFYFLNQLRAPDLRHNYILCTTTPAAESNANSTRKYITELM